MSNTINKRAEEYGEQFIGMCSSYEAYAEREDVEKAYIQGANEQQEQDKKFIDTWLRTRLPRIIENYQIIGKNVDMLNEDMRTMLFEDWEKEYGR